MSEHSPGRYCSDCRNPHSACTCGVEQAEAEGAEDVCCALCDSSPCLCDAIDNGDLECAVCGEEDACDCFDECPECDELMCECICESDDDDELPGFYGDEGEDSR